MRAGRAYGTEGRPPHPHLPWAATLLSSTRYSTPPQACHKPLSTEPTSSSSTTTTDKLTKLLSWQRQWLRCPMGRRERDPPTTGEGKGPKEAETALRQPDSGLAPGAASRLGPTFILLHCIGKENCTMGNVDSAQLTPEALEEMKALTNCRPLLPCS